MEPLREPGQRLAYTYALKKSSKLFDQARLDDSDQNLLHRIRARDRGWAGPPLAMQASPDRGSTMPWLANSRAQWDSDLAKTKRLQMTSDRAEDFFANRDEGRPKRPSEPMARAQSHGSSSGSGRSSSSTSSSSTSSSEKSNMSKGEGTSSGAAGHAVPWAHKGGNARIHGFCGQVADGSATSICHLKVRVTDQFETRLASARDEAEMATKAKWCKHCARALW